MDDKQALLLELGHILHRRNMIQTRRNNARFKVAYYKNIKEIVDAHRDFHPELDRLVQRVSRGTSFGDDVDRFNDARKTISRIQYRIEQLKNKPCSQKWLNDISGLRKIILKHEAEHLVTKYDAAKLTYATRKRVSQITKILGIRLNYQNGFVVSLHTKDGDRQHLQKSFPDMYREVEAIKAIERMLKNGNKKEKTNKESNS